MGAELEGVDSLNDELERIGEEYGSGRIVYKIGTNLEYAAAMEFGSSAHAITPNDAEVLSFSVGGEQVFTTESKHPGTKAQPYLRPALDAARRQLGDLAERSDSMEGFVRRVALVVEAEAKRRAPVDTGALQSSIRHVRVE